MSRNTLEPQLLSLLPTLSPDTLPRPLLELASSLLAQSRHNASALKAEEEVARVYACAHIACERLKTSLDLPPINSRPPVPPRIYKRLYTHLDRVLVGNGTPGRVRTPGGKSRQVEGVLSSARVRTKERGLPSKDAVLAQFRSRGDVTPSKSSSADNQQIRTSTKRKQPTRDALPPWVRPTIHFICTELGSEQIGRTVLAGMQTIAVPHGKRTDNNWVNTHLTSLLAAIYFLVDQKVARIQTQTDLDVNDISELRQKMVKVLQQARSEVEIKGKDEEDAWEGWSEINTKEMHASLLKVAKTDWQDEEWFSGIEHMTWVNGSSGGLDENADAGAVDDELEGGRYEKVQVRRGDTMFQGQWTMTDRNRDEYRLWKEEILRRADEIEKASEGAMDIDVPS